jgi:hypothetical protein
MDIGQLLPSISEYDIADRLWKVCRRIPFSLMVDEHAMQM